MKNTTLVRKHSLASNKPRKAIRGNRSMRLESLEIRDLLAANTLDFVDNLEIASPGDTRDLQLEVDASSGTAIVALRIQGTSGDLDPAVPLVFIQDTDRNNPANHVPLMQSMADSNGTTDSVVLFEVSAGSNFTIEVGGTSGSGGFLAEVMLFGSTDADGSVSETEYMQAVAAELQARGAGNHNTAAYFQSVYGIDFNTSQYNAAFDANLNGQIDGFEVGYVESNMGGAPVILDLIGDNEAPAVEAAVVDDTGLSPTDNITNDTTGISGTITDFSKIVSAQVSIVGGSGSIDLANPATVGTIEDLNQTDNEITFTLSIVDLDSLLASGTVLNNGPFTLEVTTEDELGNTSITPFQLAFEFDTIAPLAPATPDLVAGSDTGDSDSDDLTNDTTPTFTVIAEPGSSVTFSSNIQTFTDGSTVIADGSGLATFTPTVNDGLAEGTHQITATATDTAGNEGPSSSILTIEIDTLAPADVAGIVLDNKSLNPNLTGDDYAEFSGTTEPNAKVEILDSKSAVVATTTANGSGDFSFVMGDGITLALGENNFTFVATDAAGNSSGATPFTVFSNNSPTIDASTLFVDENSVLGTSVGSVTADSEDGSGDVLTYAITGIDAGYEGYFNIDPSTGEIQVSKTANLDFEDKSTFTVEIQVTDSSGDGLGGAGLTTKQNITIEVNDVNEAPVFDQTPFMLSVREDATVGTTVDGGPISATDEDADDDAPGDLTYTIVGGTGQSLFEIDGSSGDVTVKTGASFDFETTNSYTLEIQVEDNLTGEVGSVNKVTQTVTVDVIDVNEAPVITSGASVDVEENSANGKVVTTIFATDVDADDPPFLFEITGGSGQGIFDIDSATGIITVIDKSSLDFEGGTTSFELYIKVSDNLNGLNLGEVGMVLDDEFTLTINVTDVNDAPVAVAPGGPLQINENAAASTEVTVDGMVVANLQDYFTDEDALDTLTFSIIGGNNGAFAISGDNIIVADSSKLDFETPGLDGYTLTILALDDGAVMLGALQDIDINVINLNELPIIPNDKIEFPNISLLDVDDAGDVSSFSLDLGLMDPEGDTLTYSIAKDKDGFFQLNSDGTISLLKALTQGDLGMDGEETFTIEFTFDDDNTLLTDTPGINMGPFDIEITVTDNDAPVFTTPIGDTFQIDENVDGLISVPNGSSLTPSLVLSATDTENDLFTFTLEANASFPNTGLVGLFELVLLDDMGNGDPNDDTYELVVANAAGLTFDNVNSLGGIGGEFDIDLVVTDAVGRSSTKTITIQVNDKNDRPTFMAPAGLNVDEFVETKTGSLGAEQDDVVYTLSGAFADIDAAASLSYNIDAAVITGTSTDVSGAFKIVGGEIQVDMAELLDFEGLTPASITLTITADDNQGEANSTVTGDITIAINPRNELPIYTSPTSAFEVPFVDVDDEFIATPVSLGNISSILTATDPEGDNIEFAQVAMTGTGFEYFSLGTDGTISLIKNVPDEMFVNQERFFTLTFNYSDDNGASLSSDGDLGLDPIELTIRVFQNPPATFDNPGTYDFSVNENTGTGSTGLPAVSATDPEGETVTYSIDDPTGTFDIDPITGQISIIDNTDLNYEANTEITFTVFAIDAVNNMTPESITATINNVNEAVTITNNPGPFSIVEDDINGTAVGTVAFSDLDTTIVDTFTFEIVSGDPDGVFAIDSSGNITIADNSTIDFESTPSYTLEIKVTDNGGPTPGSNLMSDSQKFTVDVGDVNEAPVFTGADFDLPIVDESVLTSTEIGTIGDAFYTKFFSNKAFGFLSQYTDPEGDALELTIANQAAIEALDYVQSISYDSDPTTGGLTITFLHYGVAQDRTPFEVQFNAAEAAGDMLAAATPLNVGVEVTNQSAVDFKLIPVSMPSDPANAFVGLSEGQLPTGLTRVADGQTFTIEIWGTTLVGEDDVTPGNAWIEGFRNVTFNMNFDNTLLSTTNGDVVTPIRVAGSSVVDNGAGTIEEFNAFFGFDQLPLGVDSEGYDGEYVRLGYINFTVNEGVDTSGMSVDDLLTIDLNDVGTVIQLNGADDEDLDPGADANTDADFIPQTEAIQEDVAIAQTVIAYPSIEVVDAVTFTVSTNDSNATILIGPTGSTIGGAEVNGQGGAGIGNITSLTGSVYVVFNGPANAPTSMDIIGSEFILSDISGQNFTPGIPPTPTGDPIIGGSDPANFGLVADVPVGGGATSNVNVAVRDTVIRIGGSPSISLTGNASSGGASFDSSLTGFEIMEGFADISSVIASPLSLTSERNDLAGSDLQSTGAETSTLVSNVAGTAYTLTFDISRLIDGVFTVDGTAINASILYDSTIVLEAGGGVPLQGTIFAKDGQPLEDGSGVFVTVNKDRTSTDANGQVAELPDNADWVSEWDSVWVEVWGNTADAAGVYGGSLDLAYNTDLFTATEIEYASSMNVNRTGIIDDSAGTITGLGSQTEMGDLGNGSFVLLGRVKLESLPNDGIDVSVGGDLDAESLGLVASNTKVMLTSIGMVSPDLIDTADVDVWAVAYDANDDGKIGIADFNAFISAYGKSTLTADSAMKAALDFDNNGQVGLSDFSAFIANYGKSKQNAGSIVYPETFTQMWVGKGVELSGPDSLQVVFDKAVADWQEALGWEEPIDVKLVVQDFGDAQLGEAELLGLDENGLPQFGILTLDDDGAGLGWSSDLEGGPAEGQYDLYTVILHELGHLYGFMSNYAGFDDNVVIDHEGNRLFIGADFVAVLDDYAHHLDSTEHMGDVMNATLDPGQRKLISALDVQILETAYASATAGQTVSGGSAALHAEVTTESFVEETIVPVETQSPVSFVFDNVVDVESVSGRTGYEAAIAPTVYNELIRNGVRVTTSSSSEVQQQIEEVDSAVATLVVDDSSLLLADSVEDGEYFATEDDSTNVDDLFADWDFNSDLEG
ncbi:cadherin domain-containing protein [Bremerella sp. P1]|uniref:cadherin domain-containing protein n=1 Tax=Bremerella sp. P1 TaxID=3026424 RepID=UPI0023688EC7|nr:cadherin domain-containing protein [Bremerella sp. P1]WDI42554.1 cadherin domain-containing protein [Bremerella sp. P1]